MFWVDLRASHLAGQHNETTLDFGSALARCTVWHVDSSPQHCLETASDIATMSFTLSSPFASISGEALEEVENANPDVLGQEEEIILDDYAGADDSAFEVRCACFTGPASGVPFCHGSYGSAVLRQCMFAKCYTDSYVRRSCRCAPRTCQFQLPGLHTSSSSATAAVLIPGTVLAGLFQQQQWTSQSLAS